MKMKANGCECGQWTPGVAWRYDDEGRVKLIREEAVDAT